MSEDGRLIDLALAGDTAAFGRLVRKYQDRLFTSVAQVVGCRTEAEDVVQEAFVQAFLKLGAFQRQAAFYTWLYRIAWNTAISRRRRQRSHASLDRLREDLGSEPTDEGDGPDRALEREEHVSQVRKALAALSEEHRAILVLREIDGCDYDAIAEILDLPLGTVRSRLHRARLQLRDALQELYQEHGAPPA